MSMPQIPEESFRPTKEEVVIDLLKSIAMEENAIAHLLHAEAEKIQALWVIITAFRLSLPMRTS